ncbi:hypothetical protein PVK06_013996 [Gossypium arboreum]|uniref:Uncharacterized protein n=1 Tax=Gossypium arboreum TaxID=29729 RepID=A0ABR0PTB6_GOSAR|nr:hypothetical protein PVK06_013996 [Gossypium arboreum]
MKMAIDGVAIVATLGYFALYSNKKPEASAKDVAKVTADVSKPGNTRPLLPFISPSPFLLYSNKSLTFN